MMRKVKDIGTLFAAFGRRHAGAEEDSRHSSALEEAGRGCDEGGGGAGGRQSGWGTRSGGSKEVRGPMGADRSGAGRDCPRGAGAETEATRAASPSQPRRGVGGAGLCRAVRWWPPPWRGHAVEGARGAGGRREGRRERRPTEGAGGRGGARRGERCTTCSCDMPLPSGRKTGSE